MRNAGQYCRREANRQLAVWAGFCAFVLAVWAITSRITGALVALLTLAGTLAWKRRDILDAAASTARYRRGARGEEAVGRVLSGLGGIWHTIHDVEHRYGNIDHVVVGPGVAFAIETKAYRGRVHASRNGLRQNGWDRSEALQQARRNAMHLKERFGARWVEAVVVLAASTVPHGPVCAKGVWVMNLEDLAGFIESRSPRSTAPAEATP